MQQQQLELQLSMLHANVNDFLKTFNVQSTSPSKVATRKKALIQINGYRTPTILHTYPKKKLSVKLNFDVDTGKNFTINIRFKDGSYVGEFQAKQDLLKGTTYDMYL